MSNSDKYNLLTRWQNTKVKKKLIITLLVLIIIPIVVIAYFAFDIIGTKMTASQLKQVEATRNYVSNLLDQYRIKSLNYIKFLKTEQSLVDAIFITTMTLEKSRLIEELKKHTETLDVDSIEVIETNGKVLARGHNPDKFGDDKSQKDIVQIALTGKVVAGIEVDTDNEYSINAAGPVIREDETIAVIMTGIYFNNSLANRIKAFSGAEIMFVFGNNIVASTLTDQKTKDVYEIISSSKTEDKEITEIEIEKIPFNVASVPLGNPEDAVSGSLFILVSGKDIESAKSNMGFLLMAVTVISLFFAAGAGFIISTNIANNMLKGVVFAQNVAKGDLTRHIDIESGDEIGMLGKSLNEMVENLKQMVNKIKISANNTIEATKRIDMEKLAKGSELQAASIESTALLNSKMDTSIKSVADGAESLSRSASESLASILETTTSIKEVAKGADTLSNTVRDASASVEQMTASIKQVSQNLNELSVSSEETSSTVNEFTDSLKMVDTNAHESAILSEQVTKDASESGIKAIKNTIESMKRISNSAEETSAVINKLGEMSSQIGKILKVISDVADQTNLLSLNAAIIAAQAGEQGKSFAVVANEIGDLAERTAYSTKEIVSVVTAVQKEVREAVSSIKEVSNNAVNGMKVAEEAGNVLSKIVGSSKKSSKSAWEIEKATKELANGVTQINESIVRFTDMIRQISNATSEIEKGTDQIMVAVENVQSTSLHVRKATVELNAGSKQINDLVEDVNLMAQSIEGATKEQKSGSEQGVKAMEEIKEITQQNLTIAADVRSTVEILIEEAELLQKEVKRFTV